MKSTFPKITLMALLCLLIPTLAFAGSFCQFSPPPGASVCIDDNTETMTGNFNGFDPGASLTFIQEGIGILGQADFHGQYTSTDPNAPGLGDAFTLGYNFDEPGEPQPSDTLLFTITGLGNGKVSLDLSFFSDSLDGITPPPIPGGIDIRGEVLVTHPLTDLQVAASSVPEPGTLVMFGSGIVGLASVLRRKLKV